MAEALQDLITKNAKNNEIEDIESNDRDAREEQDDQGSDTNMVRSAKYLCDDKEEDGNSRHPGIISRMRGSHPEAVTMKTRIRRGMERRRTMTKRSRTMWKGTWRMMRETQLETAGIKTRRKAMK